jgi:hypothetical protein
MLLSMLMAAGLTLQDPAPPPPPPPPPAEAVRPLPRIGSPTWARPLRYQAIENAFRGWREPVQVRLRCRILEDGALTDCEVLSALPERAGRVALPLARDMRVRMDDIVNGAYPGDHIVFSVRWSPDDE